MGIDLSCCKRISSKSFISMPPEDVRKPLVSLHFQGVQKWNIGLKWIKPSEKLFIRSIMAVHADRKWIFKVQSTFNLLNTKAAGGGQFDLPAPLLPCGFSKNVSSKERVKPCFFVTFNIIIRHIFPENFIEIPRVVQKI